MLVGQLVRSFVCALVAWLVGSFVRSAIRFVARSLFCRLVGWLVGWDSSFPPSQNFEAGAGPFLIDSNRVESRQIKSSPV